MRELAGFAWSFAGVLALGEFTATNAQCLDWSREFTCGGLSHVGLAQLVFDDGSGPELFVGGQFTVAGDVIAKGVAKWNGVRWASLDGGIDAPALQQLGGSGLVDALIVFDDGTGPGLYAGGTFTSIGGVAANNVAKWDGAHWAPLSSGTSVSVRAFAVFDDGSGTALYAAGAFASAGGVPVSGVARWNGSVWSAVGSFCNPPHVEALAVFDDGSGTALYAGGSFCNGTLNNVARWNGASWSALALGVKTDVHAFAIFDDGSGPALFAGGAPTPAGGINPQVLSKWNGASWTNISNYVGGVWSLQVYDDGSGPALYLGGAVGSLASSPAAFGIVRWNGASNSFVGASTGLQVNSGSTTVLSMGVFDDGSGNGPGLYCSGAFDRADGAAVLDFARYDGQGWSAPTVGVGPDSFVGALHTFDDGSGDALYVGGYFTSVGGSSSRGVARWDGASWSPMDAPGAWVFALTDFDDGSGSALYAGGYWPGYDHVARWTGAGWSSLGLGLDGQVNGLATYDDGTGDALYAVGQFTLADLLTARHIAKWNGSAWSAHATGLDKEAFCATAFDDGGGEKLFVGGRFLNAGGTSAVGIASWNGTTWSQVGGGVDAWVYALAEYDDGTGPALYAGGTFTIAGGTFALHVAKWNGSTWSSVGGGITEYVSQLQVHDDGTGPALYASALGGEHLYRLDGASWTSIGQFDGRIRGLATFDDGGGAALYAGGFFVSVDGNASMHIAKWRRACTCTPVSYCTAGITSNACAAHITGVGAPSASSGSGFDLVVSNVEGQRSGLIFYGTTGPLAVPWGASSSFLCVKGPQQRTGTQTSGGTDNACDGILSLDFNAYLAAHPTALGQPFAAVTSVWAQAWFRDPPAPNGTQLSDGVRFDVCP